jgi:acrylyl-CoA reductase (NADPH)
MDLPATVAPLILRGVALLGIDSNYAPLALREEAWSRLALDLDIAKLDSMTTEIALDGAIEQARKLMAGQARGRTVVRTRLG